MQSSRASLSPRQWKSWRDVLPIHPAAELFPLMSPDELHKLAADIKGHGLRHSTSIIEDADGNVLLLDGRNRLDALALLGEEITLDNSFIFEQVPSDIDPFAYVISANIHRRHLSAEKKREVIANLIKALPEKSDRQIAAMLGVSHHTVGPVRAEMEGRGQIAHVPTRTDTKGRKQPAKKAPTSRTKPANKPKNAPADNNSKARDDIGPDSAGEANRLRARNEELARENHRLARENLALRSEIEELKAELAKRAPIDDGLDIPALRRAAP